jgi:ribosomal protein L7/L12
MKKSIDISILGHRFVGWFILTHYHLEPTKEEIEKVRKFMYPVGCDSGKISLKIARIKAVRQLTDLDIRGAKLLVEMLWEEQNDKPS